MTTSIVPFASGIGADVVGVDIKAFDDETFSTVHAAWLEHLVLRFRGQQLDKADLLRFSERFGALDNAPINMSGKPWIPEFPKLAVMSNIHADGKPIGSLGYGEAVWHTDMSYKSVTPSAAILYALEVTTEGGETGFLSMYEAYERLPATLKQAIAGKRIKHDASHNSAGELRSGFEPPETAEQAPGELHPIVVQHPESGRPALYLGRRPRSYIVGMRLDESEALLDTLWEHATDERNAWFQTWEVGDLLVWDNRCVMHTRRAFEPTERRYLLRTQVKGGVLHAYQ